MKWLLAGAMVLAASGGCNNSPVVMPSPDNQTHAPSRPSEYQAEPSMTALLPGENQNCPSGALLVGYNDGGTSTSMEDYARLAGLMVNFDPLFNPGGWVTSPHGFLTDILRGHLGGVPTIPVHQTLGDPFLVKAARGRILYSNLATRSTASPMMPDETLVPNALVVFRSDDCGRAWEVSQIDMHVSEGGIKIDLVADRETMAVDPSHRDHIYLTFVSQYSQPYISRSFDNGESWSTPQLLNTRMSPVYTPVLAFVGSPVDGGTIAAVWGHRQSSDPAGHTDTNSYYFASTHNPDGVTGWTRPSLIATDITFKQRIGGTYSEPNTPRNDWQPAFVTGSIGNFIVAIPGSLPGLRGLQSQQINVFESMDGAAWDLRFTNIGVRAIRHDAAFPVLLRDDSIVSGNTHVVLSWFDSRDDPDTIGRRFNVFAAASEDDGRLWGNSEMAIHSLRNAPPFQLEVDGSDHYFGDYFGGAVFLSASATTSTLQYHFIWMDGRDVGQTRLFSNWLTLP